MSYLIKIGTQIIYRAHVYNLAIIRAKKAAREMNIPSRILWKNNLVKTVIWKPNSKRFIVH